MPIETPIIEFDEIMKGDVLAGEEDEAISDRFRLRDRAGRNLGLRYEFTFQLGRIMKQNPNLKLPFRRYQIGEVFRDEPVSHGRFRQFVQCDADIIGDSSIDADTECLAMVADILKEVKVDAEIYVNNRKLLNSIIESVQISDKKRVLRELDKLDKLSPDEIKINLKKYADTNQIVTLFKLMEKNIEFFKQNAFDGVEELDAFVHKAKKYGFDVKFSPFLVRGLSYYTGNIFEVRTNDKMTIAGGGRYDKSVGRFMEREIPAVGISFGLDRLAMISNIKFDSLPRLLVISIEQDNETIKTVRKLRKNGISCIPWLDKLGKGMEYANSLGIKYVLFVGKDEVDKKKFKVKTMSSGLEEVFTEKQLLLKLSSI
jgi:histidyl-tRNA synthetase